MNLYNYGLRRTDIDALQTLPSAALVAATAGAPNPGQDTDAARAKLATLAGGQRAFLAQEFEGSRSANARFSPTKYGSVLRRQYPGLYGSGGIETQQANAFSADRFYGPALANNRWTGTALRANLPPMGPALGSPEYFARNVNLATGVDASTGAQYADEMKQRAVAAAGGPTAFHPLFPGGNFPGAQTPVEKNWFGNTTPFVSASTGMMMGTPDAIPPSAEAFGDPAAQQQQEEEYQKGQQRRASLSQEYNPND